MERERKRKQGEEGGGGKRRRKQRQARGERKSWVMAEMNRKRESSHLETGLKQIRN